MRGKTPKYDLRKRYPIFLEVGLVVALLILIGAFRADLKVEDRFDIPLTEQEVVQMEEIIQTQQVEKPPPPPRPPIPVEVPNDEVLEDVKLDLDSFLDLEAEADLPPPPPPPSAEVEKEPEPEIFVIVEEPPELIGGLSGLQAKIQYPEFAKKAGIEGRVFVQFIVDEQGNVTDPIVTREIGAGCDEEAIKGILASKFKPGKQRGKAVKVKMSLPVTFRLK